MRAREVFRVIVVLPLFPAGSLTDLATRYVLKWVYKTINLKVCARSVFNVLV